MKEVIAFTGRAGAGKDYQCSLLQLKGYKKSTNNAGQTVYTEATSSDPLPNLKISDLSIIK